jgi:hypothetical protein
MDDNTLISDLTVGEFKALMREVLTPPTALSEQRKAYLQQMQLSRSNGGQGINLWRQWLGIGC